MATRVTCFCSALVAILSMGGCGVVHYRPVTIVVRDELTNAPLDEAYVNVQMMGEVGRWNQGKVPAIQSGNTDHDGVWNVVVPTDRFGCCFAECVGYERKLINIERDTFDNNTLEVKLTRVRADGQGKVGEETVSRVVE